MRAQHRPVHAGGCALRRARPHAAGQVGEQRAEFGAVARPRRLVDTLLELGGVEPAGGIVAPQRPQGALPVGVRGPCHARELYAATGPDL